MHSCISSFKPALYSHNHHVTALRFANTKRAQVWLDRPVQGFCHQPLDLSMVPGIACNMQLDDADGVELKSTPAAEADNMLWPRHIDPMHWVYPNLHKVKCPVSVMAGSDTSAENPGEFIAHYIQEVTDQFPNACFERCVRYHTSQPIQMQMLLSRSTLA